MGLEPVEDEDPDDEEPDAEEFDEEPEDDDDGDEEPVAAEGVAPVPVEACRTLNVTGSPASGVDDGHNVGGVT